jgi:hypothetical protein
VDQYSPDTSPHTADSTSLRSLDILQTALWTGSVFRIVSGARRHRAARLTDRFGSFSAHRSKFAAMSPYPTRDFGSQMKNQNGHGVCWRCFRESALMASRHDRPLSPLHVGIGDLAIQRDYIASLQAHPTARAIELFSLTCAPPHHPTRASSKHWRHASGLIPRRVADCLRLQDMQDHCLLKGRLPGNLEREKLRLTRLWGSLLVAF